MGNLVEWAEKEIELACKKENPEWDGKSFDYGCACYQSALKAFKSLCEDEHSGMSIRFTKEILDRLIDIKCLTPIEDTDDVWNELYVRENGEKHYQCKRMSSLFKDVHDDGTITYHDNDRQVGIDNDGVSYHSGRVSEIVNNMFPITMPYYPLTNPYKVYTEDFLVDENMGDFDTEGFLYMITPNGTRIDLNIYYKFTSEGHITIDKKEYEERKEKKIK